MKSRYDAWLNDVALSSLNEELYVSDISCQPPQFTYTVHNYAGRNGGHVTAKRTNELTVTISFELHLYGTQSRQDACAEIVSWAKDGGKLQISDRHDQYLQCVCTKFPSIESALRWTDTLTVEFTAYDVPYFQSSVPVKATGVGGEEEARVFVPGNAEATAEVTVTVLEPITTLTVGVGGKMIELTGLDLSENDEVIFYHDDYGILHISTNETAILPHRTALSADDLKAPCGTLELFCSSDGEVSADFQIRGGWF